MSIAVNVAAAFKEAVTHHALAEEKKGDQQTEEKQGEPNLVPARLLIGRGRWRGKICHRSYLLSR
jgi:hypothetical protein